MMLQRSRGDVYLVVDDVDVPWGATYIPGAYRNVDFFWGFSFSYHGSVDPWNSLYYDYYLWICSTLPYDTQCDAVIGQIKASATDWTVSSGPAYPAKYCLSKKIDSQCKVRWNFSIAGFVTAVNLLKTLIIFYTAFGITESPLMTVGDAVSSFLEREDKSTTNMCLTSIEDIRTTRRGLGRVMVPRKWADRRFKTKDGPSRSRHPVTFLL